MHRAYKFRIYPTPEQEEVLLKTLGCCRYVYNWALAERSEAWVKMKKSVGLVESSRLMTAMKDEPEKTWLRDVSSVCLQQSLRNLDSAFVNFFKKRGRYPKFKSRRSGGSARFMNNAFSLRDGAFRVARVKGDLDVRWSRELPSEPSSCTVSQNAAGQWHAGFLCEVEAPAPTPAAGQVGVDLGIESFATLDDGRKFHQNTRAKRAKIQSLQRAMSRKKKGSKNRAKARLKLARAHQRVADARKDFLHKLSTSLARENQTVAIEDLEVSRMNKDHRLARSVGEQGWREFRTMLEHKCEWYGRDLRVVDRFYPSSKTCSACGARSSFGLEKRSWVCRCGASHDRDVNAAKNILAAGLAVTACGEGVRPEGARAPDGSPPRSRKILARA